MKKLSMVCCEELICEIDIQLLDIMKKIDLKDWNKPTNYPNWKVKDVFSHLIDTMIRKLSMQRDAYFDDSLNVRINDDEDLVQFVTRLADDWTLATKRLSPKMLLQLFGIIKDEYYQYISSIDLNEKALFSVSWAGESESEVWFDNARDYTEHWVHQQQIREALNISNLYEPKYIYPLNDIIIRALPVSFSRVERPDNYSINIAITGDAVENYCLLREDSSWILYKGKSNLPNSIIEIKDTVLWRIFTGNMNQMEANIQIFGDESFSELVLDTRAMLI